MFGLGGEQKEQREEETGFETEKDGQERDQKKGVKVERGKETKRSGVEDDHETLIQSV